VSTQLESRHFYKMHDVVERLDGVAGTVTESFALWAVIRWEDGTQAEVDQLDPTITVLERATRD
jgi:hypothetical protein